MIGRLVSRRAVLALLAFAAVAVPASAEVVQKGGVRVNFAGELRPSALPRSAQAPVSVEVGGTISLTKGAEPPQLRKISIAVNRFGRIDPGVLPRCRVDQIQPATTAGALEACRRSLVGEGSFSAKVILPEQAPFPSAGKVYAYNGTYEGRPAILAHVYGTQPAPTSYTLPFVIKRTAGTFGTSLTASLPQVTSKWGYVTGVELKLNPRGRARDFLTASCPAPAGFAAAVFPLARSSFTFAGGKTLGTTLTRSCKVKR